MTVAAVAAALLALIRSGVASYELVCTAIFIGSLTVLISFAKWRTDGFERRERLLVAVVHATRWRTMQRALESPFMYSMQLVNAARAEKAMYSGICLGLRVDGLQMSQSVVDHLQSRVKSMAQAYDEWTVIAPVGKAVGLFTCYYEAGALASVLRNGGFSAATTDAARRALEPASGGAGWMNTNVPAIRDAARILARAM